MVLAGLSNDTKLMRKSFSIESFQVDDLLVDHREICCVISDACNCFLIHKICPMRRQVWFGENEVLVCLPVSDACQFAPSMSSIINITTSMKLAWNKTQQSLTHFEVMIQMVLDVFHQKNSALN